MALTVVGAVSSRDGEAAPGRFEPPDDDGGRGGAAVHAWRPAACAAGSSRTGPRLFAGAADAAGGRGLRCRARAPNIVPSGGQPRNEICDAALKAGRGLAPGD